MTEQVPSAPALQIDDLRFAYGRQNEWSLHIPHLRVDRSEQILVRGGSGHGKSTLLHLVAGIIDPESGSVLVGGTNVHALHGAARDRFRGRTIGMIFQTFNLLHGFSAVENVMAAMMFSDIPRRQHRARALELLERLGIAAGDRDPQKMSVGQQQRVAVARAMACNPVLVLADEPTASLDSENAAGAMHLIQSICRENQAALLCVSHDPSMAERFERVESLDDLAHAGAAA